MIRPACKGIWALTIAASCVANALAAESSVSLPSMTIIGTAEENEGSYAPAAVSVGSKIPVAPLEVPQSLSVITRQRIEDQNMITIGDALHEVTGVTVTPWDSTTHQYYSRGGTMNMAYDGVSVSSGTSGIQEFDLSIYERVEVLRGPAALFTGTGQGGGVVNFVRKRGLDTFGASFTGSAGSWNNYRAEVDVGGPLDKAGRLRSRFVASWQEHDYFWDVSHKEKWLGYATLDYQLTPATVVSLSLTHQEDHTDSASMGLPAYTDQRFLDVPRSTHVYPKWNRFAYETTEVALDVEHHFANDWLVKGKILRREQDKFWKDAFPSPGFGVDPDTLLIGRYNVRANSSTFYREAMDIYASGPFTLLSRDHHLTLGYNNDSFRIRSRWVNAPPVFDVPLGNPDAVPEPDFVFTNGSNNGNEQEGIYSQVRLSLTDPLTLILGARVSDFERRTRSASPSAPVPSRTTAKETGEFTPYAGLVYFFRPNITGYVSYSDVFVPQGQLTVSGGTIDPRIGAQWEAGLKGSFYNGAMNSSLAVYRIRDTNRAMQDTDNPGFSVAAGKAEVEGWEFEVSGRPTPGLNLSAGYAYVNSKYLKDSSREGTKFSLFEPKHALKTYAMYQFQDGTLQRLSVGGGVHINSGNRGSSESSLREQGGYAVASAQLGYRVSDSTTVGLTANNLFDRKYYARVGGLNTYNVYGEPRNFMLTLRTAL